MSDILKELQESAGATDAQLHSISQLMALQIVREGEVKKLEILLQTAKEDLNQIRDKDLPDLMKAARCKLYLDDEGRKLELKDELTMKLPKIRHTEILEKLREWGQGGIITNVLSCELTKGQDNLAGDLMGHASKLGLEMTKAEAVSTATVKALIRTKLRAGEEVDLPFFGAFNVTRAKITQ